ncbi:MAG: glycosyltransferase [Bacillota bacterium]|nr:glycosyltransferase [Bacillota bacterium]
MMKVLFAESHNLDRPDPVGSHHYIQLFKEVGYDCLWLGPAVSPMHIFKWDELNRYRFKVWQSGVQEVEGIKWLVPFTLLFYYNRPLLRSLFAGRRQYRFCLPPLGKTLSEINFNDVDLLWCAGPAAYSLLDLVPHRLSCYRLADRLDKFSGIPPNVVELQQDLIKRVDFVLATSRNLWEWAKSIRQDHVHYLPNGVSDQFFEKGRLKPDDFPQDKRPVAVYVGTIDTRFDLDTVSEAVLKMEDWHFLLIGKVTDFKLMPGLNKLAERDNLTMLGPKPYHQLPAYLQHSSTGLIPFRLNELTEAVNPIKYYEYLASGLPVVAPPMRELTEMQGPLHPYSDADKFSLMIREALDEGKEKRAMLTEFASGHTWRARFKEIEKIISEFGI